MKLSAREGGRKVALAIGLLALSAFAAAAASADPAAATDPALDGPPAAVPAPAPEPAPAADAPAPEAPSAVPHSAAEPAPAAPAPQETPAPAAKPRRRHGYSEGPQWPGRFIGVRAGAGAGGLFVPVITGSETFSEPSTGDLFGSFGVEAGYGEGRWGGVVGLDITPPGFLTPSFYSSAPWHYTLSLDAFYLATPRLRIDFGLEPYQIYTAGLSGGGSASLSSMGLRGGLHYRLSERGARVWELTATLSTGVFREVDFYAKNGAETSVNPTSQGVSGSFIGYVNLTAGVQYTFEL